MRGRKNPRRNKVTIEKMFQIRNAVKVLANVSDSEWAELILMLGAGENVGSIASVKEESPKSVSRDELPNREIGSIEKKLYHLFKELGIKPNILGYKYSTKAILLAIENPKLLQDIVSGLYTAIANEFGTTTSRVERAIRHAVETVCESGNTEKMKEIFGMHAERPTNSAFIAGIVEYLLYN